jgi:hypothetical protein
MTIAPEALDDLMQKRCKTITKELNIVLESHGDPQTGAGVVLATSRIARDPNKMTAHFFRARAHKRVWQTRKIESAHERLALPNAITKLLAEEKRLKTAPHDLQVGDIIASIWGVTMRYVDFYRVEDTPKPRKVRMIKLASRMISGDRMAGKCMPDTDIPAEETNGYVYNVSMASGNAVVDMTSSIARATKWAGQPVSIYSD